MQDGVEKSIAFSDPTTTTLRRKSSQDPDNEADVQVYDDESLPEYNANTIVGPTGTRSVKDRDRVGDSREYLDQTEDGKGSGDRGSSGTDKNRISPVAGATSDDQNEEGISSGPNNVETGGRKSGPDSPAAAPSPFSLNVGGWFGSEADEAAGRKSSDEAARRKSSDEASEDGYFGMTGDPSDGLPSAKCPTGRCGGKNRFY
jgi:hypothetical protein